MNELYDYLKSKDLVTRSNDPQIKVIQKLTRKQILDIASHAIQITKIKQKRPSESILSHCPSLSLAGSRQECASIICRRAKLEKLARFASFYSDGVYIRNFFSDYVHFDNIPLDDLRQNFLEDLLLSFYIRPLVQQKIINLVSTPNHICPNCLSSLIGLGEKGGANIEKALSKLANEYFSRSKFFLDFVGRGLVIAMRGSSYYFEHGGRLYAPTDIPAPLKSRPYIMKKILKREKAELSRKLSRELGLHYAFAGEVLQNIANEIIMNNLLNTSFLTDKLFHIDFLKHLCGDSDIAKRNTIAYKYLTILVPFFEDIEIKDLIKLRNGERESFILFRSKLNRIIEEFTSAKSDLTVKDAKQIYSDIIAPDLARLERKTKNARKALVTSVSRSAMGLAGAISFGILSGAVSAELAQLIQAVGVATLGKDVLRELMSLGDKEKCIRDEDMYFLWKIRQKATKS